MGLIFTSLKALSQLINGALALSHASRSAAAVRRGDELALDPRPMTHALPTWIGPGVLLAAFLITLVNFTRMLGVELHDPVVVSYWTWMATETFQVDWEKMLEKTLRGPIARVLEALDISWEEVKSGQEQTGLESFM